MTTNSITIHHLQIAYQQTNEAAQNVIFFIHGNSGSAATWEQQFADASLKDYHLIALDLPGHGSSSFSSQPSEDYSPLGTAEIAAAVVKTLTLNKPYVLVGFSYGSNIVAEMLRYDLHPKGIFLLGMCCLGEGYGMDRVFQQNEKPLIFFYNEENRAVVQSFILPSIIDENKANCVIRDYFKTDKQFRPALMQSAAEGKIRDEIEALKNLNVPVSVLFGEKDNLVRIDYLNEPPFSLWHNKVYKLQNTGHWVHLDNTQRMNELLLNYAREVFTTTRVLQPD